MAYWQVDWCDGRKQSETLVVQFPSRLWAFQVGEAHLRQSLHGRRYPELQHCCVNVTGPFLDEACVQEGPGCDSFGKPLDLFEAA